jgi:predicted flap endonuclease-1-like 5' DNA nuclease
MDIMSQHIKKLIDSIEENVISVAELKNTIANLRNSNIHLKLRIEELEEITKEQQSELSHTQNLPSDYKVLKDLVISQRKEIREKEKQIEILRELARKFTEDIESQVVNEALEFKLMDIPGIGIKTQLKLMDAGITTINDLMRNDIEDLCKIDGLGITQLKKWKTYVIERNRKQMKFNKLKKMSNIF